MGLQRFVLDPRDISPQAEYWGLAMRICKALTTGCYMDGRATIRFANHVYIGVSPDMIVLQHKEFLIELKNKIFKKGIFRKSEEAIELQFAKLEGDIWIIFFTAQVMKPIGVAAEILESELPYLHHYVTLRDLYEAVKKRVDPQKCLVPVRPYRDINGEEVPKYLSELLQQLSPNP